VTACTTALVLAVSLTTGAADAVQPMSGHGPGIHQIVVRPHLRCEPGMRDPWVRYAAKRSHPQAFARGGRA